MRKYWKNKVNQVLYPYDLILLRFLHLKRTSKLYNFKKTSNMCKWEPLYNQYIMDPQFTCFFFGHMSRDMTKPTKWLCAQRRQISLGVHPVWSESSLTTWWKLGPLATHWAHCEDSDQTGRMPRLIWVFAGRTLTLLVLTCRGSYAPE